MRRADIAGSTRLPSGKPYALMSTVDADDGHEGGIEVGTRKKLREDRAAAATVAEQLVALEKMTVGELAEKYREVFGVPTHSRNKVYLKKRIAWRVQEIAEGGLSPRALARIEELAPLAPVRWRATQPGAEAAVTAVATPRLDPDRDPRLPPPGSVIVRVHKGIEHRITILDDGFEYQGAHHETLSQLAKVITGTPWNGYLFFGLKRRTTPAPPEGEH